MANPEHVEIVKQGKDAIARWWSEQRYPLAVDQTLDLSGAKLRKMELIEADLLGANLSNTELSQANLNRARLSSANLCGAVLRGARLIDADFIHANLSGADLSACDLARANFSGTTMRHVKMSSARVFETILGDADLTGASDLDSLQHAGPCVIDERTLRKSWPLPEVFLRGCGLSDDFIAYLRSQLGKAIEFYSCFISYSSKDQGFAERLHADLQGKGVRCWLASEDLKTGDPFRDVIDRSIRLHDKLFLILSRQAISSPWVRSEVEAAFERERRQKRMVLFPVRIDDTVMRTRQAWAADIRRTRHIGDFRRWEEHEEYQKAFERLLRDLKAESKKTSPAT